MNLQGARALAVLAAVLSPSAACSTIFVSRPPEAPRGPEQPIACSQSRVAPWIDTYVAGLSAVGVVGIAATPCNKEEFGCLSKVLIVPLVPLAIGYGISALWGHSVVSDCRDWVHRPPVASVSAPPLAPPPAGKSWRAALVGPAVVEVHTAPFVVAPVLTRLDPNQPLSVSDDAQNGWRIVQLPGRVGFVEDAKVRLEPSAPAQSVVPERTQSP